MYVYGLMCWYLCSVGDVGQTSGIQRQNTVTPLVHTITLHKHTYCYCGATWPSVVRLLLPTRSASVGMYAATPACEVLQSQGAQSQLHRKYSLRPILIDSAYVAGAEETLNIMHTYSYIHSHMKYTH